MLELHYDLVLPQKIVFGWGRRKELGSLVAAWGRRVFVVCGSRRLAASDTWPELLASLSGAGLDVRVLTTLTQEPLVADVDALVEHLRGERPQSGDVVLGIGGGSAIDLAKAVAALVVQSESASCRDYLEGVGRGLQLQSPPLPFIAVPTTGGTGAEATKNAVISSYDPHFKKSLRADSMLARAVLVDPQLSVGVPADITAYTGMDAITQLIESYISRRARPVTQALALEGLRRALPAVRIAVRDGGNRPAREAMAHAALLSGIALANSGLGLAHGVAAALGVEVRVPHGLACAVMLPSALRFNRATSESRLAELARTCFPDAPRDDATAAEWLCREIDALTSELGIPRTLAELGVKESQVPALVRGSRGNSLDGNPRPVTPEELEPLLLRML